MIGAAAVVAVLVSLSGGCACFRSCHSAEDASDLNERTHDDNWQRAEPRMRSTAKQLGATLLPVKPETFRYPRSCETQPLNVPTLDLTFAPDPDELCVDWSKEDGEVFRLLYERAQRRLLVSTMRAPSPYARLAQRDTTLFVLFPQISVIGERTETQCVCDGMPSPPITMLTGFVLDDAEVSSVVQVTVPMTEDRIQWECEEVWR